MKTLPFCQAICKRRKYVENVKPCKVAKQYTILEEIELDPLQKGNKTGN